MYEVSPIRIAPMPSPTSVVVSSSLREKTHSGRIGSAARRSTSTNAMSMSPPTTKAPMLCQEFQAHAWPPSSSARMSSDIATVSRAAPA